LTKTNEEKTMNRLFVLQMYRDMGMTYWPPQAETEIMDAAR